jgi:hypothetical protein
MYRRMVASDYAPGALQPGRLRCYARLRPSGTSSPAATPSTRRPELRSATTAAIGLLSWLRHRDSHHKTRRILVFHHCGPYAAMIISNHFLCLMHSNTCMV